MKTKHKITLIIVCLIIVMMAFLLSGALHVPLDDLLMSLVGLGEEKNLFVIWRLRMPQLVSLLLIGISIALATILFQNVFKNRAVEPGVLGITPVSALLIVAFSQILFPGFSSLKENLGFLFYPLLSCSGALVGLFILFWGAGGVTNPSRLIISGIGLNALVSGLMILMQMVINRGQFIQILNWTNGGLWSSNWGTIVVALIIILIAIGIIIYYRRCFVLNAFDEELARGRGLDVTKINFIFVILGTILSGISVSLGGSILFLGLMAQEIAKTISSKVYEQIVVATLVSCIILILAETITKSVFIHDVPVGLVITTIGAPIYISILLKRKKYGD